MKEGTCMEFVVDKAYKKSKKNHEMKLLAGKEGLKNTVSWVHILENVEVKGYVKGDELIFTTGIICQNKDDLLEFVRGLCKFHASGLVINVGPYIEEISQEVIDYCNKHNFPLFTVPWHIQLVDVTRDICSQIVKIKQYESSAASIFKEILFSGKEVLNFIDDLNGFGFEKESNYCILLLEVLAENIGYVNKIVKNNIKLLLNQFCSKQNMFLRHKTIVIVVSEMNKNQVTELSSEILRFFTTQYSYSIRIGVGKRAENINGLTDSYASARQSLRLAKKWNKNIINYEDIGIYKILLDGKKAALKKIYEETIGALEVIDQTNNTDYVEFVKIYVNYNGSVQKLADELYVHRNTINYKIKQIKKLIDCDLNKMEDQFKIMLALKIQKIL